MSPADREPTHDDKAFLEGVGTAFVTADGELVITHDEEALAIGLTPAQMRSLAAELRVVAGRIEHRVQKRFA